MEASSSLPIMAPGNQDRKFLPEELDAQKDVVELLYVKEKRTLDEVIRELQMKTGLIAT